MVFNSIISENEKEFINGSIGQGLRIDGRSNYQFRKVDIKFDKENYGQVMVSLGRTRPKDLKSKSDDLIFQKLVAAKVSCQVVRPRDSRPNEGLLIISSELYPIASAKFELGRASDEEVILSRLLEKSIKRSRALDLEGLCILAGEKVFQIRVDLHYLDHDGNLGDAGSLAALAALAHYRRPDVTVQGEDITLHTAQEKALVPLTLHHLPVSITFAFFSQGEHMVVDPTNSEEHVKDGSLTVSMNLFQEICSYSKPGGTPLDPDHLIRCTEIAQSLSKDLIAQLQLAVKESANQ